MSTKHLKTGSSRPPNIEGKLRLYVMEYCPFAQRARMILKVKNVPHDVVNVSLSEKPEWLFEIHPEGKVPVLDLGSKIMVESLDIANYLDQEYPEPKLYSSDAGTKEKQKELIKKIDPLLGVFYSLVTKKEECSPEEWARRFLPHLETFENELRTLGSTYFGGDGPNMVDFMLWPWAERAGVVALTVGTPLPITAEQLPKLLAWKKAMRKQPVVDAIYHGPEPYYKCMQDVVNGVKTDFDNL